MSRGAVRVPTILARVNAVVLVVAAAGWLRSYWFCDSIGWCNGPQALSVISSGGRINVTYSDWEQKLQPPARPFSFSSWRRRDRMPHWERVDEPDHRRRWLGFECTDSMDPMSDSKVIVFFHYPMYRLIAVPYWFICAVFALPMVRRGLIAARRRRRLR